MSVAAQKLHFPHVHQVAELTRERIVLATGKQSKEVVYLISSHAHGEYSAEQILKMKRDYWHIENRLHYRKDFVFGEDRQTARKGSGPRVLSALRNLAVSMFNFFGVENVKRCVDCIKRAPIELARAVCCL